MYDIHMYDVAMSRPGSYCKHRILFQCQLPETLDLIDRIQQKRTLVRKFFGWLRKTIRTIRTIIKMVVAAVILRIVRVFSKRSEEVPSQCSDSLDLFNRIQTFQFSAAGASSAAPS